MSNYKYLVTTLFIFSITNLFAYEIITGPTFYLNENSYLKNKSKNKNISIDRDLIGLNLLKTTTDIQRQKLIPLLKGKVNYLRWPGGTVTSFHSYFRPHYHAFKDSRVDYDKKLEGKAKDFTDFDEFIALCTAVKAKPFAGIPLQPGYKLDPITKKAVWDPSGSFINEIKATIHKISPYVSTVYIDNEIGHPSGLFQSRFKRTITPSEHEFALDKIIKAIKSVNSKLKIMPNSKKRDYLTWWSNVAIADGYGWTKYTGSWDRKKPNDLNRDFLSKSFNKHLIYNSPSIKNTKHQFENNGWSNSKLVRYEWNLAPNYSKNIKHELGAGLWNAWSLSEQIRGGVDLSFFWPLYKNPLSLTTYNYKWSPDDFFPYFHENSLNGPITLAPTGHMIQAYSDVLNKKGKYLLLDSRINWGKRTRAHSWSTHATFLKHEETGSLHGILVNKDQRGWQTIKIELDNKNLSKFNIITAYAIHNLNAYKDGEVRYTRLWAKRNGNSFTLKIPPMALITIKVDKTLRYFPSLKATKINNQYKSWFIDLGKNYDLDSIEITPSSSSKRNYNIYIDTKETGVRAENLVISRNDGGSKRSLASETLQKTGRFIRIDWRKSVAPANISLLVYGRGVVNDRYQKSSCQVRLSKACHARNVSKSIISDKYKDSDSNPLYCKKRASQYYSWCKYKNSHDYVESVFYKDGKILVSEKFQKTTCIINLSRACHARKLSKSVIHDRYKGSDTNPQQCKNRAIQYYHWCGYSGKQDFVEAKFYKNGKVIASKKYKK